MLAVRIRLGTRAVVLVVTGLVLTLGPAVASAGAPAVRAASSAAPDAAAARVLGAVRAQLGDPYLWGGNGPDSWDCSGLTSLWRTVGGASSMPRVSAAQQAWSIPIPREQALPGDLVFFGDPTTHVGVVTGAGLMIDAAASRAAVVERAIWSGGVVRYGRVSRPGMPKVAAWTPPPERTAAVLAPTPTPARSAPAPARSGAPAPARSAPAAAPRSTLRPLPGLPGTQARPSSRLALGAARNARGVTGSTTYDDVSLVRTAWRHAGGGVLPTSRTAIVARGRRVPLADARVGDLVVYNAPATHLGIYLGGGLMVDASKTLGRVVVRPVYTAPTVLLVRLG